MYMQAAQEREELHAAGDALDAKITQCEAEVGLLLALAHTTLCPWCLWCTGGQVIVCHESKHMQLAGAALCRRQRTGEGVMRCVPCRLPVCAHSLRSRR